MMRDHTKLQAFELADEVAVLVYRVTVFPREELGSDFDSFLVKKYFSLRSSA